MDGILCAQDRCLCFACDSQFVRDISDIQIFQWFSNDFPSFFNFPMKFRSSPQGCRLASLRMLEMPAVKSSRSWKKTQSNFTECGRKCLMKSLQNTAKLELNPLFFLPLIWTRNTVALQIAYLLTWKTWYAVRFPMVGPMLWAAGASRTYLGMCLFQSAKQSFLLTDSECPSVQVSKSSPNPPKKSHSAAQWMGAGGDKVGVFFIWFAFPKTFCLEFWNPSLPGGHVANLRFWPLEPQLLGLKGPTREEIRGLQVRDTADRGRGFLGNCRKHRWIWELGSFLNMYISVFLLK